ncbi:MAG: AmmeMemoRadiSam system protein B, partial [Chitinispirillaceae bacterium]|nr:AmmeMemoRadiSam system protein B [Chitinispirillaceae bacterium]
MSGQDDTLFAQESIRKPAVAGQFYPANAGQLRQEVERYLAGGKTLPASPRLLVIPHAGFVFSGPVAGKAYATLDRAVQTVIILGPSHHAWFDGLAVPKEGSFQTPLGSVAIDHVRIKKLLSSPLVRDNSEAHGPEHCLEVQLPFLQVRLKDFKIVPVLTGKIQPEQAAELLLPLMDDRTVVIASTDFSHYMSQENARKTDDRSIATILAGNASGFLDACGETSIRIVMVLARRLGGTPKLLDARTSYETYPRHGSGDKVVGYASIVYLQSGTTVSNSPARQNQESSGVTPEVKAYLLRLARQSLDAAVRGDTPPVPEAIPAPVKDDRGCFVTLTKNGDLRGCIG